LVDVEIVQTFLIYYFHQALSFTGTQVCLKFGQSQNLFRILNKGFLAFEMFARGHQSTFMATIVKN